MRNAPLYGLFALLFGFALVLSVTQTSPSELWGSLFSKTYAHTESQQGILFVSDAGTPSEVLSALALKETFILSPIGVSGNLPLNSWVAEALIQQQIVFGGHQKLTQTIVRVYDSPTGTWLGCQTDFGTATQSTFIKVPECSSLLSTTNAVTLSIAFPDASRAQPLVEVTPSSITIYPVVENDIPGVNFLLMRALYSDAETLIGLANETVEDSQN